MDSQVVEQLPHSRIEVHGVGIEAGDQRREVAMLNFELVDLFDGLACCARDAKDHAFLAPDVPIEVCQEEVAAPPGVERLDVVGLELRQRRGVEVDEKGPDRFAAVDARVARGLITWVCR